jgi:glycosyltransferase involved in cell wall biosynthesis
VRFSILLPTRDRLEYLRQAVETVRRQSFSDWEVVVSDNDSEDDVAGFVASLDDDRMRYVRTERFIPVTDNWNNALAHASGEYVLMLGDDDGLVQGALDELDRTIARFEGPDVIYSRTLQFAYPGVLPDYPDGYLGIAGIASFFEGAGEPFVLDPAEALDAARAAMRFELAYDYNMQFATFARRLARPEFFRSTFPDYYAMNLLFATAPRIVVHPKPLTIVGVTPKSYGFYRANERAAEGAAMLATFEAGGPAGLPGDDIRAGWLAAARELERKLGLPVHEERLHLIRGFEAFEAYSQGRISRAELTHQLRSLPLRSRIRALATAAVFFVASRPLSTDARLLLKWRLLRHIPNWNAELVEGEYSTLLDVFERQPL